MTSQFEYVVYYGHKQPDGSIPHKWLAFYSKDAALFEAKQLRRNPDIMNVRIAEEIPEEKE